MAIQRKRSWWYHLKRLFTREKLAPWDRPEAKVEREPWGCPICGCKIELEDGGEYYRCVGCRNRGEVEMYLQPLMPKGSTIPDRDDLTDEAGNPVSMSVVPACGWRGRVDGFGTTWTSYRP